MENNVAFQSKWATALKGGHQEERSVFVPQGSAPRTQRQFILYREFETIAELAKQHKVKTALEVGCGRGTMALYLNQYLGVKVTATDISEEAIELAKENFKVHHGAGTVVLADAAELPFPDHSFDMTVSVGLLEHLKDYTPLLREQYRVLNKGGVMVSINIPKKHSIQTVNNMYRAILQLCGSGKKLKTDYFRNCDMPEEYAQKARAVGFRDIRTFHANPFPIFTPVGKKTEQRIAFLYGLIYRLRTHVMEHPFKGSRLLSQEHFLVGVK